ncbi:metallophosphoesterase family protein [Stratiformator vulcanicus]|uniref:Phosphodiesterase n=1 Tax=Stratiformator vulcanicus TaxID=2527980 RepID=A0A517R7N0_9PLAN|nr:metallophosphoesterase family protein [Stratiformator vulcanicus]QDT39833.1 phosphodiesterase [Stratiformator vulcanicus]
MRILVLADIHANWEALRAIDEPFDACLCAGDIVDYGAQPVECVRWVRENVTAGVRGNHDHAVAQRVVGKGGGRFREWSAATRALQWQLLGPQEMKYLARLPLTRRLVLDDRTFFLVHGTPRDPMDEYIGADPDMWRDRLKHVNADFVLVGHTHLPFVLELGDKTVLNPGSLGQPRDGDARAAYAIIDDGVVTLKRTEYDVEATIATLREAAVPIQVMMRAEQVLRTGSTDKSA